MNTTLSRRMLLGVCCAAALLAPLGSSSQGFPNKPITLIVPWPAGGSTDRHLRSLAELAGKNLGQNIIIENKPGGGGTTGPGTMALPPSPMATRSRSTRSACCASRICRRCSGIR